MKNLWNVDEIYLIYRFQTVIAAAVISLVCVSLNLFQNILIFFNILIFLDGIAHGMFS